MGNLIPLVNNSVSGPANTTVTTINTQTPTGPVTTTITTQNSSSSSIIWVIVIGLVLLAIGYALFHFGVIKLLSRGNNVGQNVGSMLA